MGDATKLALRPVTLTEARAFVTKHHSHNGPPVGWLFGVGVATEGELCGVAVAGRPVARLLQDGATLEVTRVCTDGTEHACSMLYGAITRAAKALGWSKIITYTLESEAGIALKATGWTSEGIQVRSDRQWWSPGRPDGQVDLFGERTSPREAKVRWVKQISGQPALAALRTTKEGEE